MTQDTYRFAYEEANAELREILGQFERLKSRKEQMEQVVEVLKVVLMGEDLGETNSAVKAEQFPFLVHHSVEVLGEPSSESAEEPEFEPEPAYAEQSADPFQKRIDMALRHGLGGRDSRVMPRSVNGLLSRV